MENNADIDEAPDETVTKKPVDDEHYRLAGRPPFKTIISLGTGPVISELVGALYGIVDTIWVQLAVGDRGMAAVSEYSVFDNIGRAFGGFVNIAGNTKTSQLYGMQKEEEAKQLFSDLFRMSLIFSMIVPAIMLPIVKPIAAWYGADMDLVDLGYTYIVPLLCCSCSTCLLFFAGGFLQGEGRTGLFGIINIICFCLNMFVFDPIFLFGLKMWLRGAACSTILSELIPGIILIILFYCGKFDVKPDWRDLFKKFGPHLWPSLKVGLSQLIAKISFCIPAIIVRKFLGMATGDDFADAMSGYNATVRFIILTQSLMLGINTGFTPAASYANGARMSERWLWLLAWATLINFIWGSFTTALTWTIPKYLSMIFSRTPEFLKWSEPMMRTRNSLGFLSFMRYTSQSTLQSLQKGWLAMIMSFISNFVALIGFTALCYYVMHTDGVKLMYCYALQDAFGFVMGCCFIGPQIYRKLKEAKSQRMINSASLMSNSLTSTVYTSA